MRKSKTSAEPSTALRFGLSLAAVLVCAAACSDDVGGDEERGGGAGQGGAAAAGSGSGAGDGLATGGLGDAGGAQEIAGQPGDSAGGQAATCGDGVMEPSECEPAGTALCSDDCVEVATSDCFDCEQGSPCYEFSENCLAFEGDERALCYDVHECVNATGCGDGENTLTSCFCGELSTSECIDGPSSGPGSPMGPCAEIIRRSMGGDDATNSQVLTRYINVDYPGGGALARMNCDKVVPECLETCGF